MASCTGCGRLSVERTVTKEGPNTGRTFRVCSDPSKKPLQCSKFFVWADPMPTPSSATTSSTTTSSTTTSSTTTSSSSSSATTPSAPPIKAVDRTKIHNLRDPKYNCVWGVETLAGPRADDVRALLQRVADHIAPVLRYRGWRVKRLMESVSKTAVGVCTTNGREDEDACSANIQLNVRVVPSLTCTTLRSFHSLMSVLIHEITHISIGLEDIHPPAFHDLMRENRRLYEQLKSEIVDTSNGSAIDKEILHSDERIQNAAIELPEEQFACGVKKKYRKKSVGVAKAVGMKAEEAFIGQKRKPLLNGAKMVDKRSKVAKEMLSKMESKTQRELAAAAAAARFASQPKPVKSEPEVITIDDSDEEEEEEEEDDDDDSETQMTQHDVETCACRACYWERELFLPLTTKQADL